MKKVYDNPEILVVDFSPVDSILESSSPAIQLPEEGIEGDD